MNGYERERMLRDLGVTRPRRPRPRMRGRLTVEGEVRHTAVGRFLVTDGGRRYPIDGEDVEILPDPVPTWKPGDVVVVRFGGEFSVPYTYVRGMRGWPGERARAKTDAEIDALYREGKVEPVLQAGGERFDERRLP